MPRIAAVSRKRQRARHPGNDCDVAKDDRHAQLHIRAEIRSKDWIRIAYSVVEIVEYRNNILILSQLHGGVEVQRKFYKLVQESQRYWLANEVALLHELRQITTISLIVNFRSY